MEILYGIGALVVLIIILKILSVPVRFIKGLVMNGITGLILLFLVNLLGSGLGLSIEMNIVNALIAGILGIPGIIILLLIK